MPTVASAAIVVYDYVLTFELENHYMWSKQRWNLIRVLFFVNRYMPFVDITVSLCAQLIPTLSDRDCKLLYRLAAWSFCFSIALSEVILTMRTWTLWKTKSWLGIALAAFYLGCWVPIFIIFGTFLTHANVFGFRLLQYEYAVCIVDPGNVNLYLCWILVLVYDTGTMILMVIAGAKLCAQFRGQPRGSSALVFTLYRDGITYYIALFILSVANIITIVILPRDLVNLFSVLQRAIHTALSSRVILHLREQAGKRNTFSDTLIATYISTEAS